MQAVTLLTELVHIPVDHVYRQCTVGLSYCSNKFPNLILKDKSSSEVGLHGTLHSIHFPVLQKSRWECPPSGCCSSSLTSSYKSKFSREGNRAALNLPSLWLPHLLSLLAAHVRGRMEQIWIFTFLQVKQGVLSAPGEDLPPLVCFLPSCAAVLDHPALPMSFR